MKQRIATWAILSIVVVASLLEKREATASFFTSKAQSAISFEDLGDCPFEFNHFRHTVTWHAGGKRLLISATQACGGKFGNSYDLKDVTLTIYSKDKAIAQLHSNSGVYSMNQDRVILENTQLAARSACIGNPEILSLDLRTSEMRMPGLRVFLNSDEPIPCINR